jgi:hypothetical protein
MDPAADRWVGDASMIVVHEKGSQVFVISVVLGICSPDRIVLIFSRRPAAMGR